MVRKFFKETQENFEGSDAAITSISNVADNGSHDEGMNVDEAVLLIKYTITARVGSETLQGETVQLSQTFKF